MLGTADGGRPEVTERLLSGLDSEDKSSGSSIMMGSLTRRVGCRIPLDFKVEEADILRR